MRIAFFHGLESKPFSEKNQILVDLCGELTEVELSFFTKIKIVRHDTIGSVCY